MVCGTAELGGKKGGSTMQTQVIKRKMKALVPTLLVPTLNEAALVPTLNLNEAALKTATKKGVANGSIISHGIGHGSFSPLTLS